MNNPSTSTKWFHIYSRNYWQNTIKNFRAAPVGHLSSFLILHELTALIPLPIFYYTLNYFQPSLSIIPRDVMETANAKMSKLVERMGWSSREDGQISPQMLIHLATSYAIVKVLLPLRMMVCIGLTPAFARSIVMPISRRIRSVFQK